MSGSAKAFSLDAGGMRGLVRDAANALACPLL